MQLRSLALYSASLLVMVAACAEGDDTDSTSTTTTTSSNASSSSAGGASSSSTASSGGATSSSTGTGGSAVNGCMAGNDHVLISEVATQPDTSEFIEIWNPGSAAVDLSDYYISDNGAYHTFTGGPWNPTQTAGTDFLAGFPAGTMIPADGVITIALGTDYEGAWGSCPDFVISGSLTCGGNSVPAMVDPPNGTVGNTLGSMISNEREMVMLFCWDGSSAEVRDVDYLAWGTEDQPAWRADKSGVGTYANDTPAASQSKAPTYTLPQGAGGAGGGGGASANPGEGFSIGRCDSTEDSETASGGNGIAGHDETSEDMSASFSVFATASPGAKNSCN